MHANEALDSITVPRRGVRRGQSVHTVFGRFTAFHVKDDGSAPCAAALALIHRLRADIDTSGSDSALAAAVDASGGNKREPRRQRRPSGAVPPCGPNGLPDVRGPLQRATTFRTQWATQQLR
jgi:hypothetical protein